MALTSSSRVYGLTIKSSAPFSIPLRNSDFSVKAVRKINGIVDVEDVDRILSKTSYPSTTGIEMSHKIKSGVSPNAACIPFSPSVAVFTS
jgi:hypothetical protein